MLFVNVYGIDNMSDIPWRFLIYCVAVILVLFVVGLGLALAGTKVPERRGVIWQCCFRSNFAIIGMPLAAALGGEQASAVAAVVSVLAVPLFNILAVIALSVFTEGNDSGKLRWKNLLRGIVTNPLTLGVLAGLLCIVLRSLQQLIFGEIVFAISKQLNSVYTVLNNLKSMTTPCALLILGGQCEFSAVKGLFKEITVGTLARIVLAPVIAICGALLIGGTTNWFSCGPNELPALIALFGSPMAVSGAIMAGEMKNDAQLGTQLVVWTSVGSILTVFLTACILMACGLLAV